MSWIMKALGLIKTYWFIALGLLVSGLFVALKILTGQNTRLRRKVETAEVRIHRAKVVAKKDKEIEAKFNSRRAEARDEIKNTGGSSTFRDPNKLRDKDRD